MNRSVNADMENLSTNSCSLRQVVAPPHKGLPHTGEIAARGDVVVFCFRQRDSERLRPSAITTRNCGAYLSNPVNQEIPNKGQAKDE